MDQLQIANRRLENLSNLDGLTGAHNRRYLDQALESGWLESTRNGSPYCLALIDADHFKQINDTHGHQCGDEVLRRLVRSIDASTNEVEHVLARIGGEEFVLLLPGMDLESAHELSEQIRRDISLMRFVHEGVEVTIRVSIGIAHNHPDTDSAEDLLARADRALYQAKQEGRDRVITDLDVEWSDSD